MGLEARCRAAFGGQWGQGRALLEEKELRFGGDFTFKVALADVKAAEVKGGVLHLRTAQGEVRLELGRDAD
jgi:hypothetical protein